MAKIADADKMRAGKLDSAWVKAVWAGRVGKSKEHLLLTTKGCIKSRVVRRIPDGNQASYHAEVQGLPWDTLKGSAEMLRNSTVRLGEPPRPSRGRRRQDGSPAQARTTTTTGQEATRDDSMPGSSGVVERWSRQAVMATRGQMFNARWVDEQHKEKSRYDFANTPDPTMFAAASDTAVGRVVEFTAVIQNYSMFTFDVTSAYTHAWEDELVFLEPPPEEIEEHGDCVAGVQDRGRSTLIPPSEARKHGSEVSQWNRIQSVRHSTTCVTPMERKLHVDDGHRCGKKTIVAELLSSLAEKIEMK